VEAEVRIRELQELFHNSDLITHQDLRFRRMREPEGQMVGVGVAYRMVGLERPAELQGEERVLVETGLYMVVAQEERPAEHQFTVVAVAEPQRVALQYLGVRVGVRVHLRVQFQVVEEGLQGTAQLAKYVLLFSKLVLDV
jgi:hypothetical protein